MTISIKRHLLDGVPFHATPNKGGKFAAGMPDAIIIHFTGGSSAESSVSWLQNPQSSASAHVVIGRDGSIVQLVPFDTIAWHAGRSSYGGRSGYNQFSIGIELDNPGRLTRTEGGDYVASFGRRYPPDQVIAAVHRNEQRESFWLTYSEDQINATFELCSVLATQYPIREILGHEEIAPGRKIDPGPAFPLDKLRQRLIQRGRDEDGDDDVVAVGEVTASKLNFRASPDTGAALVSAPLPRGTRVEILGQRDGWYQARVSGQTGWLSAQYVKAA